MKTLSNNQIVSMASAAGSVNPVVGVSSRYSFVPTLDAVNLLRDAGWLPVAAEQSRVRVEDRDGYQRHLVRFARPDSDFDGERVDLVLYNSHDRGCAFKLAASVWRKICGNGLMVPAEFANFSHKHVGFNPDLFVESAMKIANSASVIADNVQEMKVIELEPNERGVFALAAHKLMYDDLAMSPIRPEQLLQERRFDDKGKDLWSTFNVVQENIIKGGVSGFVRDEATGRIKKRKTRSVQSIDRNVKLNQALWVLTEEMKRIKSQQ